MVEIKEVVDKKQRKEFINFFYKLYKGNKFWAPPFKASEMDTITPGKVAASEFCDSKWFLAYKEGKVVGRIGAIINHKTNKVWQENAIRFTRFDFVDDKEVSGALLKAVEDWGKEKNLIKVQGPLGYSDLDQEGMLVEGFNEMSTFITLYNYEYYVEHMIHHGYIKEIDWMEYRIKMLNEPDKKIERISQMVSKKFGYRLVEYKSRREIKNRANELFDVWNEAYKVLFGAAQLSQAQVDEVVSEFLGFVNPDFIKFVEDKNGKIIAFGICFPSLTKAAQKVKGNLFPFGIFHFLRALKKNDTLDMYLIGVMPEFQKTGVNAIIMNAIIKEAFKYGIKFAETNPELEDNHNIQTSWKNFEKRQHRRRRSWQKSL